MPVDRFYYAGELNTGMNVILEGHEFVHLSKAVRKTAGEAVQVVNGMGALAEAKVAEIGRRHATLTIIQSDYYPPSETLIVLAQAFPKLNRLEGIIEKTTELGVDQIWLFPGERSEKKGLSSHQVQRLNYVAVSAMKQCGRLYLPQIIVKSPLEKWKDLPSGTAYFGDVDPQAPRLADIWQPTPRSMFFVGPESGFSDHEHELLRLMGGQGVKLHHHILRTDTASIAAMSIIGHLVY
ncbi:MAG: RsmE family RNA methyltransferase [Chlamydiota bacterium]